jgi:hypothetical protein
MNDHRWMRDIWAEDATQQRVGWRCFWAWCVSAGYAGPCVHDHECGQRSPDDPRCRCTVTTPAGQDHHTGDHHYCCTGHTWPNQTEDP